LLEVIKVKANIDKERSDKKQDSKNFKYRYLFRDTDALEIWNEL
jgi:hypothetical protein